MFSSFWQLLLDMALNYDKSFWKIWNFPDYMEQKLKPTTFLINAATRGLSLRCRWQFFRTKHNFTLQQASKLATAPVTAFIPFSATTALQFHHETTPPTTRDNTEDDWLTFFTQSFKDLKIWIKLALVPRRCEKKFLQFVTHRVKAGEVGDVSAGVPIWVFRRWWWWRRW